VQPFLQWEINNYYIFWVCVCSPRYPYHLWHALLHNIFLYYLINGTIFEKRTFLNLKYLFRFSVQILSTNFFHSKKKWAKYDKKNVYWSLGKAPFIRADFSETWIFSIDFRKMLMYKISWKSVQWEPSFPCGQTDGGTDMTKLTVAFRNSAKRA